MAIGDTVNAGLMRTDFSAFQQAGLANAQANAAFGNAVGNFIDDFYEKKKLKEEKQEREKFYRSQGFNPDEAKAASGDKELANFLERKRVEDRNFDLAKHAEQRLLNTANFTKGRQVKADELAEQERLDDIQADSFFMESPSIQIDDPNFVKPETDPDPDGPSIMPQRVVSPALASLRGPFAEAGRKIQQGYESKRISPQKAREEVEKLQARQDATSSDYKGRVALAKEVESVRQLMEKPLADIASDFNKDKQVQDFKNVKVSYNTILMAANNPSAAGDLSLIIAYMKVLDPGSTVREGEFANAENATGVPEKVKNFFNNWTKGEKLSKEQREDFVNQARTLVEAREKSIEPVVKQTRQKFDRQIVGQGRGLSVEAADKLFEEIVFPNIMLEDPEGASPATPQPPTERIPTADGQGWIERIVD